MNELDNGHRVGADRSPLAPMQVGILAVLKIVVIVLAIIGGVAVVGVLGMGWMHVSMMGGTGWW